jgi:hypothetical protein
MDNKYGNFQRNYMYNSVVWLTVQKSNVLLSVSDMHGNPGGIGGIS